MLSSPMSRAHTHTHTLSVFFCYIFFIKTILEPVKQNNSWFSKHHALILPLSRTHTHTHTHSLSPFIFKKKKNLSNKITAGSSDWLLILFPINADLNWQNTRNYRLTWTLNRILVGFAPFTDHIMKCSRMKLRSFLRRKDNCGSLSTQSIVSAMPEQSQGQSLQQTATVFWCMSCVAWWWHQEVDYIWSCQQNSLTFRW